jgi:hypothetical protein
MMPRIEEKANCVPATGTIHSLDAATTSARPAYNRLVRIATSISVRVESEVRDRGEIAIVERNVESLHGEAIDYRL